MNDQPGAPQGPSRPPTLFDRLAARARVGTPGRVAPKTARRFRGWFGRLVKLAHRPTLIGWDHLPSDRPYLLVANHSGGGLAELACLATLWLERFGEERGIAGMAHPVVFHFPLVAGFLRDLGAIPAAYEPALAALARGLPVLAFPGGDHEAFRPLWQAHRVDLAGRKGFLRIARRAWVPVVPLGIRGSHFTLPILWRSRLLPYLFVLPRLLGGKRLPVTLLGVVGAFLLVWLLGPVLGYGWAGALAWLWISSPLVIFCPILPWTVRLRIGEAIEPEELFGEQDDTSSLEGAYARVEAAIQELVSTPWPRQERERGPRGDSL
jgi:1-acyl-sn-glycerol-3-phosphate acyltransferase